MVSILCDGLQHRSVLLLPRPILGTSSHATDFIISGKHVASLFDYVPVNDTAYVYGSLRLEEKGLGGRLRLDALTSMRDVEDVMACLKPDQDAVVNNMANQLRYDVRGSVAREVQGAIEKVCWIELFTALQEGDVHTMVLSLKQLAKQQYLKVAATAMAHA